MNPSGKSYIAILHEYLQQSLKLQPVYEYKENGECLNSRIHFRNVCAKVSSLQITSSKQLSN